MHCPWNLFNPWHIHPQHLEDWVLDTFESSDENQFYFRNNYNLFFLFPPISKVLLPLLPIWKNVLCSLFSLQYFHYTSVPVADFFFFCSTKSQALKNSKWYLCTLSTAFGLHLPNTRKSLLWTFLILEITLKLILNTTLNTLYYIKYTSNNILENTHERKFIIYRSHFNQLLLFFIIIISLLKKPVRRTIRLMSKQLFKKNSLKS